MRRHLFQCEVLYRQGEFNLLKAQKETELDWRNYRKVEVFTMPAGNINSILEEIFDRLNNSDASQPFRSMSVGDLVILQNIVDGHLTDTHRVFRCQMNGWSELQE